MKYLILVTSAIASLLGSCAYADDAAPAVAPTPDNVIAPNIGIASDYRYRGISQSRFQPALQGGVDYTNNPTGLYAGTWLSTIKWIKDGLLVSGNTNGKGPVEWDLYGGKRGNIGGGFSYDVGGLYYYYPTNNYSSVSPNANANTFELYGQVGYSTAYIKYSHSLTNLFGTYDSKNSGYLDLTWNPDIGSGFTLNLHVGHQKVAGSGEAAPGVSNDLYSYTDWKVGVSKTVDQIAGITFGLAVIGTNANKHNPYATPANIPAYSSPNYKSLGRNGLVLTAVKTF
jgi:uncharacterized protein (TIGR02001 family)